MLNPAEHCKAIGAGVGDRIKPLSGPAREITYIGHNYIHVSYLDSKGKACPETWDNEEDISSWTKVPPPPRFAIVGQARHPSDISGHVNIAYIIRTRPDDVDELYRRVSAAIAEPESKGEGSEVGPVVEVKDDRNATVFVLVNGHHVTRIDPTHGSTVAGFKCGDMARLHRIGAEAIKNAINSGTVAG